VSERNTGARLGDVSEMQWAAIDLEKSLVTFTSQKTRRKKKNAIQIPLHPDLEKQLLKRPGVGNAPLFPSLAARETGGRHGLSAEFAAIMRKARVYGTIVRRTAKGRANTTKILPQFCATASILPSPMPALIGNCDRSSPDSASERMNEVYTHREVEPLRPAAIVQEGLRS
jgi:hypothetical protein